MDLKKLVINAVLAAFWTGLGVFAATGEFTKPALFAAGAAFVRAFVGYVSAALGKPVPVDA